MGEIIVGKNPIIEALRSGRSVNKVFIAKGLKDAGRILDLCRIKSCVFEFVDRSYIDKTSNTDKNQGVMAFLSSAEYVDIEDLFGGAGSGRSFGGFSEFFESIFGSGMGARPSGRSATGTGGMLRVDGRDVEQPVEISLHEAFSGTVRLLDTGSRRLEVKIPAGVRTGSRVRIAGAGEPGANGGRPGDLYLVIHVQDDPRFERRGDDLYLTQPVDLYTMILGGEVVVETLDGRVSLRIPPETKAGRVFRLRGQGMPRLRDASERGDLLVKVMPIIPQNLTEKEKQLFRELASMRRTA